MKAARAPRHFDFIGKRWVWFSISIVIVIVAAVSLISMGLNFGVDFTGGTQMDIKTKSGTTIEVVRGVFGKYGYPEAQIQQSGTNFIIKTPKLDSAKKDEITAALKTDVGMEGEASINDVGPGWGKQVSQQAIIALIVFIFAVVIYISIRFEFKMAMTAIIEIVHDFIITIGVYALFAREVSPATVIAVLTILGYSLYDTIVIFDRIKENADQLTRQSKKTYSEMVNESVNQVLVRSINTSLTTLIPITALMFFGGQTLTGFAFALFIGVLSGTYSSIFLAPPILAAWKESEPKYSAYREQLERREARKARTTADVIEEPALAEGPKPRARRVATGAARKAAPAGRKTPATAAKPQPIPTAKPKPIATAKAQPASKPGVQPTPKPAGRPGGAAAGKASAKSRTKGPGSGKKKKKR